MAHFDIQPLRSCALPEAARFLSQWVRYENDGSLQETSAQEDPTAIERRLTWLLLENPVAHQDSRLGFCIRDSLGEIRGLNLCFPGRFLADDLRLTGLGAGSFFVEPEARALGFYLFKKYLSLPGYSFFFTTTSNTNSAPLWENLGGSAVPDSQREYMLPLNLETLLPALAAEKSSSATVRKILSLAGRCANPLLRLSTRPHTELTVTPCRDWSKLAALFRRHRPAGFITADRSADFLQWRYGHSADPHPCGVYLVRDRRGEEGWFALGRIIRGRRRQICGSVLMDVVWPRELMNFREVFGAMLQVLDGKTAAVFFRPRRGVDLAECSRQLISINRGAPSTFAITRRGDPQVSAGSLDLTCADGDTALPLSPRLVSDGLKHAGAAPALRE